MQKLKTYIFIFVAVLFGSCGGDHSSKPENSAHKKTIFRYNQDVAVTSLDPAFAKMQSNIWAVDHLFNRLVELDDNLNIIPAIAKSWTISDDGLVYTFSLRDDVFFHDDAAFSNGKGRKVTANDIKYSYERLLAPETGSPGTWVFNGKLGPDPFKVVDEHTFQLTLSKPFRPMLGILSMHYLSIVPKEAIEKYGKSFRSHPVGTGPFKFKKWLENQSLFLTKNDHYFEKGLPYLDAIKVSFIGDKKTAFLEFMSGKLDFLAGIESSFVNELLKSDGSLKLNLASKFNFQKNPFLNSEYLGIRMKMQDGSPLEKKKVRQALNYAIDRKQMLKSLRNNVGKPANSGFTPIGLPSFNAEKVKGYTFNTDKASKLLAEAGYPNGKNFPEIKLQTTKSYLDICTFITRQWNDIGIKVQIDVVEPATLRNMMSKEQVPFFRGSWIADYPDAENFFSVFYGKQPAPPNYTRFKNKKFDALYEASIKENDEAKRYNLYQKMDQILVDEAPVIFLFYDETAQFSGKNISGLSKNAFNLLKLKQVKKN